MATIEGFKDKSGDWQDRTEWHNVLAWQRLAEIVGEYARLLAPPQNPSTFSLQMLK